MIEDIFKQNSQYHHKAPASDEDNITYQTNWCNSIIPFLLCFHPYGDTHDGTDNNINNNNTLQTRRYILVWTVLNTFVASSDSLLKKKCWIPKTYYLALRL